MIAAAYKKGIEILLLKIQISYSTVWLVPILAYEEDIAKGGKSVLRITFCARGGEQMIITVKKKQ